MSRARARTGSVRDTKRKSRSRPIPKWLTGTPEIDDMAKRRCLMILSVLSGDRPVTEMIVEHGISRGTYYNLETRALNAMLAALLPTASAETSDEAATSSPMQRIAQLEKKIAKLEQDKRRGDRLLYLTRQILGPGAVKQARGRPSKKQATKKRPSTTPGRSASLASPKKKKGSGRRSTAASRTSSTPGGSPVTPSIPKTDGVDER